MSPKLQVSNRAVNIVKNTFGIDIDITDTDGIIRFSSFSDSVSKSRHEVQSYLRDHSSISTELLQCIIPLYSDSHIEGYVFCRSVPSLVVAESIRLFLTMAVNYETERNRLADFMQASSVLVTQLFMNTPDEFGPSIETLAGQLGYRINHPMAVVAAQLDPQFNYCLNINLGYEIAVDEIKKNIVNSLQNHMFFNKQDILAFTHENYFVIIKNIEEINDRKQLYQMLRKTAKTLDDVLQNYHVFSYYISVGRIAGSYHDICFSFLDTVKAISYAKALSLPNRIIAPEDVMLSLITNELPEELVYTKINPVIEVLDKEVPSLVQSIWECFDHFINNGFNISDTSALLFLHRNTVKKRFAKLTELTGFSPFGNLFNILMLMLIKQKYFMKR